MHKTIYFWLAMTWTMSIIVLSLMSFTKTPKVFTEFASHDKLAHFVFYFVFVFFWGNHIFHKKQIQSRTLFFIFYSALILGGIIELCQEFLTKTRTADIYDMFANFVGALMGMGFLYIYKKRKKTT